jgi:dihydrofolate reductase
MSPQRTGGRNGMNTNASTPGEVVWHITMSVDGFIAGPDHAMDWMAEAWAPNAMANEVMAATGAILGGRGWYDAAVRRFDGVEGIYGGAWSGPVHVLTHHAEDAPEHPAVTFVDGPIDDVVAGALAAADGRNLEIFGADTARQCLDAGILDAIVIHLAPVLLGDGIRLYGGPGGSRVALERAELASSDGVTDLRFRVVR